MKLWISGEVDSYVGDYFRHTLNEVEQVVNEKLLTNNYGTGISEWDVIFIITEEGGEESFKYKKKDRSTDIRMCLDHQLFLNSDIKTRKNLMLEALARSLDNLSEMAIGDVSWQALRSDLFSLRQ
jgi:hypothetical protein